VNWRYRIHRVGVKASLLSTLHVQAHTPHMALKTNWRFADKPTLRLVMQRLEELETQCLPGPARTRFRVKRLAAVTQYRKSFGGLSNDRLWVDSGSAKRRYQRPLRPAEKIYGWALFAGRRL
jgi:hypothetical protein